MPCLAGAGKVSRAGSRGCDSFRSGKTFHPRRDDSLGPATGGRLRSQRAREGNAATGRQRLHRAGWRRDAHSAQRLSLRPHTEYRGKRRIVLSVTLCLCIESFLYHPRLPNMSGILISILLGLTAAAANVFGGAIIVQRNWERRYLSYFVALGAGFMLATALVEMVPESLELGGKNAAVLILLGYLITHFFEHTLTPHFHFGEETHHHEFMHAHKGYSVLLGLIIHTFFDGIAIAAGFLVSNALGWIIFLAIFLHKIPEGFTVSSVMLASGRSRGTAWGASGLLGGATVAGSFTMAVFHHHVGAGLPLSAGVTIYVAASDLVPEVNKEPAMRMALLVFVGAGLFFLLGALFHM